MDAVVRERLEKWGFSGLIPQFRDNQIDEETFLLLDSDTLKELILAIGPRMKFFKLFKDFTNPQQQHRQQQQNEPHPDEIQADEDEPIEEMDTSVSSGEEEHPPVTKKKVLTKFDTAVSSGEECPPLKKQKIPVVVKFDMKSILKDTFYDELTTKEALTSKERRQICHILVTYLIQHYGPNPSTFIKESLARSLVEQLPFLKDKAGITGYEAWMIAGKKGRPASGCLEERLRYIRRRDSTDRKPPSAQKEREKEVTSTTPACKLHVPKNNHQSGEISECQIMAFNLLPLIFKGRNRTMKGRCTEEEALKSFID